MSGPSQIFSHGWRDNDEHSRILRLGGLLGIVPTLTQAAEDASFGCITDTAQRATANFASQNRFHVRLIPTASPTHPARIHFIVGDAHHDRGLKGGTCKSYSFPGLGRRYQHSSVSFNDSRNAIATIWRKIRRKPHFDNWGNTAALKQCNGRKTKSDGMVAAMPQPR